MRLCPPTLALLFLVLNPNALSGLLPSYTLNLLIFKAGTVQQAAARAALTACGT